LIPIAPSLTSSSSSSSSFLTLRKKKTAIERERETGNKHQERKSSEEDDAEAKMEDRGFDEEDAIMRHMHDSDDGPPLRTLTCFPSLL